MRLAMHFLHIAWALLAVFVRCNIAYLPPVFEQTRNMNMTIATNSKFASFGFSNFFGGFAKSWENYQTYRTTVKELSNLSDRELTDLGISRWDIDRIARESVEAR